MTRRKPAAFLLLLVGLCVNAAFVSAQYGGQQDKQAADAAKTLALNAQSVMNSKQAQAGNVLGAFSAQLAAANAAYAANKAAMTPAQQQAFQTKIAQAAVAYADGNAAYTAGLDKEEYGDTRWNDGSGCYGAGDYLGAKLNWFNVSPRGATQSFDLAGADYQASEVFYAQAYQYALEATQIAQP